MPIRPREYTNWSANDLPAHSGHSAPFSAGRNAVTALPSESELPAICVGMRLFSLPDFVMLDTPRLHSEAAARWIGRRQYQTAATKPRSSRGVHAETPQPREQ